MQIFVKINRGAKNTSQLKKKEGGSDKSLEPPYYRLLISWNMWKAHFFTVI